MKSVCPAKPNAQEKANTKARRAGFNRQIREMGFGIGILLIPASTKTSPSCIGR